MSTLTYFNIPAGGARGFVARVCLRKAQAAAFKDNRVDCEFGVQHDDVGKQPQALPEGSTARIAPRT